MYGDRQMIRGTRLNIVQCECYSSRHLIGIIKRNNDYDPPVMPTSACCGGDGINYPTQEAACTNGTYPLHGGYCGACSSHQDINIFNITRNNMTNIATKCGVKYVLFGKNSAIRCMNEAAALSVECTECWVENMGCDAAHCMTKCAIVRTFIIINILHVNNTKPDGSLNDCLACDEGKQNSEIYRYMWKYQSFFESNFSVLGYCGKPFIVCSGANRRRSGIMSDIDRPQDTIWKRYAC
ncbi:unnamed protein product [Didymodactylos carnosus]|uniref:Uncharacterized protein n=1 Tax=Didymodactylos carnosus TaxID=1234261 RepID=A0A8S2H806_9BILA|nr:unnamed protein product [Didymodactylos carnosus]CAF3612469.1 unnamed protein product [Didymodactylos carnosus]